jgi:hypothetical protein
MDPMAKGQVIFPAGEMVDSETGEFDPPPPPMPGIPVPVFPLPPEGDGIEGMVLDAVEPADGIVGIPPLGVEVPMPDIALEELVLGAVVTIFGIVVVEDWLEAGSMPFIEGRVLERVAFEAPAPIAPMADVP